MFVFIKLFRFNEADYTFYKTRDYLPVIYYFFVMFISSCHSEKSQESDLIRFNQLGFFPSEEKTAVVLSEEFGGKGIYDPGVWFRPDRLSGEFIWYPAFWVF